MSAAEVLLSHQWRGEVLGCGCGWNWPEERTYFCGEEERVTKAHVAHQLDALRAAGYAVVELPKPDDDSRWHIEDVGDISTYPRGGVGIKNIGNDLVVADCEARNLAAVLLAAAAAAEADA